jgi:hypothetical protein
MSGIATAVVASSVIGGVVSSSAASKAANAQTQAADQANATQQAQYDQTRADNMPWMNRGNAAGDRLSYLLGTGGTNGSAAPGSSIFDQAGYDAALKAYQNQQSPAQTQSQAANPYANRYQFVSDAELDRMDASQFKQYQDALNGVSNTQAATTSGTLAEPTRDQFTTTVAGTNGSTTDPQYGSLLRNFTQDDLNNDVVYNSGLQFGLDQGTRGINNQAAASGSQLSGATLKALTKYGNDYASTKAGDAYNRFQTNKNSNYNMLAGVAGTGQTANSLLASTGANTANQVSQNQLAAGNSRAASSIGSANALTNSISSGYNMYQNNQLVNALSNKTAGVPQLPGVTGWVSQG